MRPVPPLGESLRREPSWREGHSDTGAGRQRCAGHAVEEIARCARRVGTALHTPSAVAEPLGQSAVRSVAHSNAGSRRLAPDTGEEVTQRVRSGSVLSPPLAAVPPFGERPDRVELSVERTTNRDAG